MRLLNQTCLVTGSSSGIGKAIARKMAMEGANVIINYYSDKTSAEELAHDLEEISVDNEMLVVKGDVSNPKDVENIFKKTIDKFGALDILVSNSGIQIDAPSHELTLEQWNRVMDVNLTGQFLCAQAAIKSFLIQGIRPNVSKAMGKIIHMSSVHEIIPWAGHLNYASSKGGLLMLMKSLALEYGKDKIRVNSIAPGAIQTAINEEVWSSKKGMENLLKLIPYGRIGQVEDVANAAVWLASDESDYVTGTTIFVDGGMSCYPGFLDNG